LKTSGTKFLAVDVDSSGANDVLVCDLRKRDDVARLFQSQPVHSVIHLAGILPTAFRSDRLVAADLNLTASIELLPAINQRARETLRLRKFEECLWNISHESAAVRNGSGHARRSLRGIEASGRTGRRNARQRTTNRVCVLAYCHRDWAGHQKDFLALAL
jgi:hypothetical protein